MLIFCFIVYFSVLFHILGIWVWKGLESARIRVVNIKCFLNLVRSDVPFGWLLLQVMLSFL